MYLDCTFRCQHLFTYSTINSKIDKENHQNYIYAIFLLDVETEQILQPNFLNIGDSKLYNIISMREF